MDIKTFFKKVASTLEHEVKTGVNTIQRELNTSSTSSSPSSQRQSTPAQPQQQPQAQPQPQQSYQAPRPSSESGTMAYFKEILTQEFVGCVIRENVPVQELVGYAADEFQLYATRPRQAYKAEWGKPYNFVLYEGDRIKGVVVIGKRQVECKYVSFLISKMYAKKMGVPFVSFYLDAPNERDYVIGRFHKFLG